MKCPLTTVISAVAQSPEAKDWGDCIKEECAWWEGPDLGCALALLSLRLGTICEILTEITQKMPHAGQFTKYWR